MPCLTLRLFVSYIFEHLHWVGYTVPSIYSENVCFCFERINSWQNWISTKYSVDNTNECGPYKRELHHIAHLKRPHSLVDRLSAPLRYTVQYPLCMELLLIVFLESDSSQCLGPKISQNFCFSITQNQMNRDTKVLLYNLTTHLAISMKHWNACYE